MTQQENKSVFSLTEFPTKHICINQHTQLTYSISILDCESSRQVREDFFGHVIFLIPRWYKQNIKLLSYSGGDCSFTWKMPRYAYSQNSFTACSLHPIYPFLSLYSEVAHEEKYRVRVHCTLYRSSQCKFRLQPALNSTFWWFWARRTESWSYFLDGFPCTLRSGTEKQRNTPLQAVISIFFLLDDNNVTSLSGILAAICPFLLLLDQINYVMYSCQGTACDDSPEAIFGAGHAALPVQAGMCCMKSGSRLGDQKAMS